MISSFTGLFSLWPHWTQLVSCNVYILPDPPYKYSWLSVLRPGHWACRCSEVIKRAAEFEKHRRWWAEITHITGCLSSPAGKDLSGSKNSRWAAWRGLPRKSKLCSFFPTEQLLGECLHSAEPCTSRAGSCWLKAQGMKLSGRQLAHWGRAQTSQNFWGSLSLWPRSQPIPFTPLSQDLSPPQYIAAAAAKALQSCPTLCDPTDGSPPGSPVPGILQARTLEWVAISFSNAWKCEVKVKSLSRLWLFVTPWTAAHQAPPSMGFSRQEHWSGVPLPSLQYILRFSQNKTSSDLQLCHFKEMLYFMGSSEHHRDRKEASVREARWDWNYQGWADILGPVPPGGRASGHGTILVRRHRSGLHQNMCCQLWEDGGPPSTQVKAHSSLATLDPKYSDRVSKEGFNNLLLSKQK